MHAPLQRSRIERKTGITGIVLAGGRGLRMNGRDKGLLGFRGQLLVQHVLEALAPQTDAQLIIANRNLDEYRALGVPVISDIVPGFGGPLVGILTGLAHAATPWALFAPCDAPGLPADLASRLMRSALRSGAAFAATNGDDHYACCLLSTSLRSDVQAVLTGGSSAIRDGLAACDAERVEFGDAADCIWNLNTPLALQAAEIS